MRKCDVTDAHAVRDVNGDKRGKAGKKTVEIFLGERKSV